MAIVRRIRIYDLAREVKQDTKRDGRSAREGADVSARLFRQLVIAEKVRSKYFPKTKPPPKRAIKIIKAAARLLTKAPPVEVERHRLLGRAARRGTDREEAPAPVTR